MAVSDSKAIRFTLMLVVAGGRDIWQGVVQISFTTTKHWHMDYRFLYTLSTEAFKGNEELIYFSQIPNTSTTGAPSSLQYPRGQACTYRYAPPGCLRYLLFDLVPLHSLLRIAPGPVPVPLRVVSRNPQTRPLTLVLYLRGTEPTSPSVYDTTLSHRTSRTSNRRYLVNLGALHQGRFIRTLSIHAFSLQFAQLRVVSSRPV